MPRLFFCRNRRVGITLCFGSLGYFYYYQHSLDISKIVRRNTMSHHRSRRPSRHRRPAPPSPTRGQVRQRISRLSVLYKLEALLELQKPEPDAVHLGQLNEDAGLLNQILSSLEETA